MAASEKSDKMPSILHDYSNWSSIRIFKTSAYNCFGNSFQDSECGYIYSGKFTSVVCIFREKFGQKRSPPRRAMKIPAITMSAVEPGLILFLRSSMSNSFTAGSIDAKSMILSSEGFHRPVESHMPWMIRNLQ